MAIWVFAKLSISQIENPKNFRIKCSNSKENSRCQETANPILDIFKTRCIDTPTKFLWSYDIGNIISWMPKKRQRDFQKKKGKFIY